MTSSTSPETPSDPSQTRYKRVMLKISGEALMGDQGFGLHPPTVERIAREGREVFYRGEIARVIGDYMQANGGFVSLEWDCKWRSAE